jgi:hypothetical protein
MLAFLHLALVVTCIRGGAFLVPSTNELVLWAVQLVLRCVSLGLVMSDTTSKKLVLQLGVMLHLQKSLTEITYGLTCAQQLEKRDPIFTHVIQTEPIDLLHVSP